MTFEDLLKLKPNWDSYGAVEIDYKCIGKAQDFTQRLDGLWQIVPMADGGVQLEQHEGGWDIEISIERRASSAEAKPT